MIAITEPHGPNTITGLIVLSSEDVPGMANGLFECLAPFALTILQVEQVVIGGRLILSVLISLNRSHAGAVELDLNECATKLDADIAIAFSDPPTQVKRNSGEIFHIRFHAQPITATILSDISDCIRAIGAEISSIVVDPKDPLGGEFTVSSPSAEKLRGALSELSRLKKYEILTCTPKFRDSRKLVVLDVDSTLIEQEVIDLLARRAGMEEEVKQITESAMRGELDFAQSLMKRVSLLKGLPEAVLAEVRADITFTAGVEVLIDTLHRLGHSVALVTGGFTEVLAPIIDRLQIKHFAGNNLEILDGVLTGKTIGPIVDRAGKAQALENFARGESIPLDNTVAIGDGANDLDMISAAGIGIAFCAKPAVQESADTLIFERDLSRVIYLLGISDVTQH